MKFLGLAEVNLQAKTQSMNCIKCLRAEHSKNIWFLDGHTFLEFILGIEWVNKSLTSESAGQGAAVGPVMIHLPVLLPAPACGTEVLQGLGEMKWEVACLDAYDSPSLALEKEEMALELWSACPVSSDSSG